MLGLCGGLKHPQQLGRGLVQEAAGNVERTRSEIEIAGVLY
jgi:hypothetical protein